MEGETLIEQFKAFYFDYRRTTEVRESFLSARIALAYYVIHEVEGLALAGDLKGVSDVCRQFREIQGSTYGSNDSVMERLEREFNRSILH